MELHEEENTPEKRVDRIFAMMDKVSLGWGRLVLGQVRRGPAVETLINFFFQCLFIFGTERDRA